MSRGTLLAIVFIAAYAGFEAYAIGKVSHRMEPGYIHTMLLEAQLATRACNGAALELESRFLETLTRVEEKYRRAMAETDPQLSEPMLNNKLSIKRQSAEDRVSAQVETLGCDDAQIRAHFQRFRIYARRS